MNMTNALAWTLIHFLWQGALIALLVAGSLASLKRADSRLRYAVGCAGLLLMLISASITMSALLMTEEPISAILSWKSTAAPVSNLVVTPPAISSQASSVRWASAIADYFPALLWMWFFGVATLSIRSLGGWIVAERYTRHTLPAEDIWKQRFIVLEERLGILQPVRLAVSARAQVPAVIGWLRPIVLMPASVLIGLTPEQVEALLAHELAHVRRHDFLVNLLQTAAETLFFYHPAVWWLNRVIRNERENCCDDLAVQACGNVLTYARALAEMERLLGRASSLAMAANGGSLLARIQRLLGKNARTQSVSSTSFVLALTIGVFAMFLMNIAGTGLAQHSQSPTSTEPQTSSGSWLDEIEAEGFRNLDIDVLIRLKTHGIDGDYIRQTRAAGYSLSADDLVRFRSHGIDEEFISEMKAAGLQGLSADDLIRLRSHGANGVWIKEVQSLGFPQLSVDDVIRLRSHGIDPDYIREAQKRFKGITLEQLVMLRSHGIL